MDKNKVTIILIALAVVLALFLLYQYGKNKIETSDKLANADADLEIKKANDAYLSEKEEAYRDRIVKPVTEGSYEDALQQTTIADGYTTLEEYRKTLTSGEKSEYDQTRAEYIKVMGKDPGLMSLDQLRDWWDDYYKWRYVNQQYLELTGESKSYLDPEFDSYEEMRAAYVSAKAAIEIAQKEADDKWLAAYTQLNTGSDGFQAFVGFTEDDLRKYCPTTAKLTAFHAYLQGLALDWESETVRKLEEYMTKTLYPAIRDDLKWTTSNHNNVDWINGFDIELCNYVIGLDPQSKIYLMERYGTEAYPRVKQYTRVNSTRDPHDSKVLYTMSAALRNRLTVSEIQMVPESAKSIQEVGYRITYDSPKHCGCDRSELVTSDKKHRSLNSKGSKLIEMIIALENAASDYTSTYYGIAYRNGSSNKSVLEEWVYKTQGF